MEAIAEAAPRAYVRALWPILLEGLLLCATEPPNGVVTYRGLNGFICNDLDDEEDRSESPLLRSVQLGIERWADSDPESFLDFVDENKKSDLLLVHRLLAIGLRVAIVYSPQRVFEYLAGDPRRLVLGPFSNVHKDTIALIAALCPLLDNPTYAAMESMIIDWRYHRDTPKPDDVGIRQQLIKWSRQHRLRLLRGLPTDRRSSNIQRLVEEEERAFPDLIDKDVNYTGIQFIGSPVSAKQMDRASDTDILNLFKQLTDDVAWDHKRNPMKGGAIEAGRELAELAKTNLPKVLRIIRALDPRHNEIPVSCALRKLVPAGLSIPAFYSLVTEMEDKGFVASSFRREAAYAIANAASKEAPVPDELVDRMEKWLVPTVDEDSIEIASDRTDSSSSVLWERRATGVLPNGNYPTLHALTAACLTAEPPRLDRWLSILESHARSMESTLVWEAMLHFELRHLNMVSPLRAEALVDKLLARAPSIVNTQTWVRFIAYAFRWASAPAVRRWLTFIVGGDEGQLQWAGELVCLRHALFPAETWSRELVQVLSNDCASNAAVGVAHSVANLWHEPMARPVVQPLLLRLLRCGDDRVLTAVSAIFLKHGFSPDAETRELLDVLVECPDVLKNGRAECLPEILAKLVSSEPERVCQVAHALLDVAGAQMGSIATSWYLRTEWLLDIALQLQDMGPTERAAGSKLFERMLEFNMPQAREMTLDLDRRMPVGQGARRPLTRKSRNSSLGSSPSR
jgi:hypothetical protein